MNDELIKREALIQRINAELSDLRRIEFGTDFDLSATIEVLLDCRTALSRKYVPMTDDELHCVWVESGNLNATETMRMVEAEVIRRAGLEVSNECL